MLHDRASSPKIRHRVPGHVGKSRSQSILLKEPSNTLRSFWGMPTQNDDGRSRCFCGAEIATAGVPDHVREAHMGTDFAQSGEGAIVSQPAGLA